MHEKYEAALRVDAEALFRAHAGFIASFLHRFGTPAHEIDDLVQEVFIIAHRKGGYVSGPAHPRTWLASIAVHVAQSSRRARKQRERKIQHAAYEALDRAGSSADPHQQLETRHALQRLQGALEGLPLPHRAAFVLHEVEGEACENIAAQYHVPVGTIYSRLHTARKQVLAAYERKTELQNARAARTHAQPLALRWQ